MTKRENEIYRNGFFAGRNSVKSKPNYSEEDIEEIRDILSAGLDAATKIFSDDLEPYYKTPFWFTKVPFLKRIYKENEERNVRARVIVGFLSYMYDVGLPSYLKFLNSSVEISEDVKEKR